FPTANLDISHFGQLIPAPGVYAVRVRLENTVVWKRGMMNVGNRPTFNGRQLTLETHIFNFDGDIYDQLLLVSFVKRIRGEQKFDSPEELAAQLKEDEQTVLDLFEKEAE
ncbi:MAG: riboflavin kinase, partial [Segatella copri]